MRFIRFLGRSIPVFSCSALACLVLWAAAPLPADDRDPAGDNPLADLATLEYRPAAPVKGELRLSGSSTLEQAAAFWAEGFRRIHPDASVTLARTSTETGWRDLVEGKADVALLSRPFTAAEIEAASRDGKRPVLIPAGFDQLVWIVHESNPVAAAVEPLARGGRHGGPGGDRARPGHRLRLPLASREVARRPGRLDG